MRVYTVTVENATIATAGTDTDLVEISPADDKPVWLLGFSLDNVGGTADAGDAGEELLRLAVIRGHTSSGSGGSAATPVLLDVNGGAVGFAAETNNTTIASGGTTTTPVAFGWNVRIPCREQWGTLQDLSGCPMATQANTTIVVRLLSTVADDISASWTLWVAEA